MHKLLNQLRLAILIYSTFLVLACSSTSSNTETQNQINKPSNQVINYKRADQDYQKLVLALKNTNAPAEVFDSIIRVYPLTSKYDPYDGIEQAQKLVANASMDTKNWRQCLMATNAILNDNYTSLTGHYGAMVCQFESGNEHQGNLHKRMLDGFMDAVWRSGNGQTPSNAFYVTSANDLYAFIQLQNHIAVGQSLVYVDEKPVHAMSVRNLKNKKESIWYFDVTAPFRKGVINRYEN
ncbi:DUF4919 domain-containing protein [Glaciecola sp. KUL10]|uniref:DUF4919 domain-containing protein n=1 Tax=Glaciecola sp. (strain KUL10) TaxID=2161813 RepID=UPI000D786408|nr:DUF4919 domain-containing protein [Glaciecola sp. KUL10]